MKIQPLRRTSRTGYVSRTALLFGGWDFNRGRSRSVVITSLPTRPDNAIRAALRCLRPKHRPFTNRIRDNIRRRMRGLEPLSSDSDTESETETEEKLSEATTSTMLPSSSMQKEQDLQADAPPLKLEDVIPPTQASSSSRNKKRRNKEARRQNHTTT